MFYFKKLCVLCVYVFQKKYLCVSKIIYAFNLHHFAAARRTRTRRTPVTMLIQYNIAIHQFFKIKIANMHPLSIDGQIEHLVEIAVVHQAVPTHRNGIAAHNIGNRRRIEGINERRHVFVVVFGFNQIVQKP